MDLGTFAKDLGRVGNANRKAKVVVAMSGGVDSSVVAASLHRSGCEVIGITLHLYSGNQPSSACSAENGGLKAGGSDISKKKNKITGCCGTKDVYDAQRVADMIGFPHYLLDYEEKFRKEVIDDFVSSYLEGETPSPCIRCNQKVKFLDLLEAAKRLDADYLVTGHYARCVKGSCGMELHRAFDDHKDQSYFLGVINKKDLDFIRFPLGDLQSKSQTRDIALELGLDVHNKPDSMGICFVAGKKYTDFISSMTDVRDSNKEGNFFHKDGRYLGKHRGIMHYTVGQRRGLNPSEYSDGGPFYVIKIDKEKNIVFLGGKEDLRSSRAKVNSVNWLGDHPQKPGDKHKVLVKVRAASNPSPAEIQFLTDDVVDMCFSEYCNGIVPGQAAVFYDENFKRVLGCGWLVNS